MLRRTFKILGAIVFGTYFWYCALTPNTWHFIDAVNLVFHEAGHAITFFLPSIITAFMGSGLQILVPIIFIIYFYNRREVLSAYLLILWLGQNLINVSIYIKDAITMNLSLLGGDYVTHDWNFILGQLGLLEQSLFIANIVTFVAMILMTISTALIILYLLKTN